MAYGNRRRGVNRSVVADCSTRVVTGGRTRQFVARSPQCRTAGLPSAGDVGDRQLVARITRDHDLEAASLCRVRVRRRVCSDPAHYFENNVQQGIGLIDELRLAGVRARVLSTCATLWRA